LRSSGSGLNAFLNIFGMFLIDSKLVPVIVAPSVPTSTISIADGLRTAMTCEPSIVAPRAMPRQPMTRPMAEEAFIGRAPRA
jgi:hypothetical protein